LESSFLRDVTVSSERDGVTRSIGQGFYKFSKTRSNETPSNDWKLVEMAGLWAYSSSRGTL
ncbi:MAG TPA: hypothetical protein VIE66_14710, partial [Methylocella sp.]